MNLRLTLSTIGDVGNRKDEDENEDEDRLRGEKRGESGRKRADSAKSRDITALKAALAGFKLASSVSLRDLMTLLLPEEA